MATQKERRKCGRKAKRAARIAQEQGGSEQMNWCGEKQTTISPRIITAKTTYAGRPSRRPNANGRSGRTRVNPTTNCRYHAIHYARKSRRRRNHIHAARDWSIQSPKVGP